MESSGRGDGAPDDPDTIAKVVEQLISQGYLDQMRRECLVEVDTKPAYQNMVARVDMIVKKFLDEQKYINWRPFSKNQVRSQLRQHLMSHPLMDTGVERVVDQTVDPKIFTDIEPTVESAVSKVLGMDKPCDGGANGRDTFMSPGKMSTISSEDINMAPGGSKTEKDDYDSDESQNQLSDASSPGLRGLRGNISPLTPDRAASATTEKSKRFNDSSSDIEMTAALQLRGGISPLTPPAARSASSDDDLPDEQSPRTPPMPPPPRRRTYEEASGAFQPPTDDESMSPVSDISDTELSPPNDSPETPDRSSLPSPPPMPDQAPPPPMEMVTPPLPPPPPPPPLPSDEVMTPPPPPKISAAKPRPPMTSPIESSSSDEMENVPKAAAKSAYKSSSASVSDISDTDFAVQSEGEKGSTSEEGDLEELERARAALQARLALEAEESDEGEVHSEEDDTGTTKTVVAAAAETDVSQGRSDAVTSPVSDDNVGDDHESAKRNVRPKDDEDGNSGGAAGGDGQHGAGNPSTSGAAAEKTSGESSKTEKSSHGKSHSHHSHSHHSHRTHHRSSSKDESRHKHRHSSSDGSRRDRDRDRDRHRHKDHRDKREDRKDKEVPKDKAKEREKKKEMERLKIEKITEKISQKDSIKSEKFKAIDMFAPKATKQKPMTSPITAITPRSISGGSVTSPAIGKPSFPSLKAPTATSSTSSPKIKESEGKLHSTTKTPASKAVNSPDFYREVALSGASPIFERRVLPELPVPKCNNLDKKKQHQSDIEDAKKLLEEARQRRAEQMQREKEEKKRRKSSTGGGGPEPEKVFDKHKKAEKEDSTKQKKQKHVSQVDSKKDRKASEKEDSSSPSKRKMEPKRGVAAADDDNESDEEWRERKKQKSEKSKHRKKSLSKKRFEDSSSGEEEAVAESKVDNPVMTRKLTQKSNAHAIMNDDPETKPFTGFDVQAIDEKRFEIVEDDVSDTSDIDETCPPLPDPLSMLNDAIFLDKLSSPEKALKELKKFGGKPKLVRKFPDWLDKKLSNWSLQRSDVDVIYPDESGKIRNKRKILTEKEFDAKFGAAESEAKKMKRIEEILMEQMPDIVSTTPEPIKREENGKNVVVGAAEEDSDDEHSVEEMEQNFHGFEVVEDYKLLFPIGCADKTGNTFGMDDFIEDDSEDQVMQIMISAELKMHYLELVKYNPDTCAEIHKILVYPIKKRASKAQKKPKTPKKSAKAVKHEEQQIQDFVGGGLKEVSDEFVSELDNFETLTPPSFTKGSKL